MATTSTPIRRTLMRMIFLSVGAVLAVHRLVQMRSEGIAAQDTDDEWRIGRGEGLGRPFHEVRKIVNEDGLDLIFGGRFCAARRAQA